MAKGINVIAYRGIKARRGKKAVMHLTDDKENKIHLRFSWKLWKAVVRDIVKPMSDEVE